MKMDTLDRLMSGYFSCFLFGIGVYMAMVVTSDNAPVLMRVASVPAAMFAFSGAWHIGSCAVRGKW